MKQPIMLLLVILSFTAARSQSDTAAIPQKDSLQYRGAVKDSIRLRSIALEQLIEKYRKLKYLQDSLSSRLPLSNNRDNQRRFAPTDYSTKQATIEVLGNILLSVLAGRTNHALKQ